MARKLSEVVGEDALIVVADIVDLLSAIEGDGELESLAGGGAESAARFVSALLRSHPEEVLRLVADVQGEDVEAYREEPLGRILSDAAAVLTDESLSDFLASAPTGSQQR